MPLPQFDDLPFNARPDLTPYLIHLTKSTSRYSGLDNLVNILREGRIWGSSSEGFIKGPNAAACFMDVPFQALKYILTSHNADPQKPRYEPYGVVITKGLAYDQGCRPVLYLSDTETWRLRIKDDELWRVVRFEVSDDGWICWLHEREWRCKGDFQLPGTIPAVLVKNTYEASRLAQRLAREGDDFYCVSRSIIPLDVMSQGLVCP